MFVITAVIAFGALYEIFFNFMLWSALEVLANNCGAVGCNPDLLYNSFPSLRNPLSLTFSTKIVTLVFAMCIYSLYYLHRIDREIERKSPTPATSLRKESYEVENIRNVPITRSATLSYNGLPRNHDDVLSQPN